jgi:hypothetical protein
VPQKRRILKASSAPHHPHTLCTCFGDRQGGPCASTKRVARHPPRTKKAALCDCRRRERLSSTTTIRKTWAPDFFRQLPMFLDRSFFRNRHIHKIRWSSLSLSVRFHSLFCHKEKKLRLPECFFKYISRHHDSPLRELSFPLLTLLLPLQYASTTPNFLPPIRFDKSYDVSRYNIGGAVTEDPVFSGFRDGLDCLPGSQTHRMSAAFPCQTRAALEISEWRRSLKYVAQ